MRAYEDLVAEAETADIADWGFGWLEGRATEERPPWGYARLLAARLREVDSALDLDTGGGEVLAEAEAFPPRMVATEAWPPSLAQARSRLVPRGIEVVATSTAALQFPEGGFDLVTARHPVVPPWDEIHRVLRPGGRYFAQHVGPGSAFELIEHLLGPLPEARKGRDPVRESAAAEAAGLEVVDLRTARLEMRFLDIGAVVWILRKCVWWVPDFAVPRFDATLRAMDARMRAGEPFVAHSTRHLIEARRPG